ncbi:MAG: hypothetical protein ACRCT8_11240 [Lacipirellulaceae bacterium]
MALVLEGQAKPRASERSPRRVVPSRVDLDAPPFTLEQELEPFGSWIGEPVWAPPLDCTSKLAESMLRLSKPFTSIERRWEAAVRKHRDRFTQVREIELGRASIRLPKGKFFVTVTERRNFDQIAEKVPACVQTRLDEFLDGPGKKLGATVYYLKPLCVEVESDLVLTTREDLMASVDSIRDEVFAAYRRRAPLWRTRDTLMTATRWPLAGPRWLAGALVSHKKRAITAYQAKLEFERRKTALGAAKLYRKCRTNGCTFDEMLALTSPLSSDDVVEQYGIEKKLSRAKQAQLRSLAAGSSAWMVALSAGALHAYHLYQLGVAITPAVATCDPAFVAEFPSAPGVLHKIGHFDEIDGVMHIEL